jgi:hypothetical protein
VVTSLKRSHSSAASPVVEQLRGTGATMKLVFLLIVGAIATVSGQMSMGDAGHMGHSMPMSGSGSSSSSMPVPDACVTKPTLANCTSYKYPLANAAADVKSLCTAMPFMAACSVAAACNASGAGATTPTGDCAQQCFSAEYLLGCTP